MQVVAISNHKLNSDIYSTRSLSIHRRILVKNLLTLLYEMNPMLDWFDDGNGLDASFYGGDETEVIPEPLLAEEEQNGWIEQTLSAAGLDDDDDGGEGIESHAHARPGNKESDPKPGAWKITTPKTTKSKEGRGSSSSKDINNCTSSSTSTTTATPGSDIGEPSTPSVKVIESIHALALLHLPPLLISVLVGFEFCFLCC